MHNIFPNKTCATLIVLLVILNVISLMGYVSRGEQLKEAEVMTRNVETGRNIFSFQKMFVDKVLKADGVVDYETRRELEQAAGKTNNKSIIDAWNALLSAKTEDDGQDMLKNLLSTIAEKGMATTTAIDR